MDIDNLPSESLTCGRCGDVKPWSDYTFTALERADGDGASCLVCADCRRAEHARRRPISLQARDKRGTLRRAEVRAVELRAAIDRASSADIWSHRQPSPAELTRQLGETQAAIQQHRADLSALHAAAASGATQRQFLNRRTVLHGRSPIPPSIESNYP